MCGVLKVGGEMRFTVLGRTGWLIDSAKTCIKRGHRLVLVATCPSSPESDADEQDFERLAAEAGCPFVLTPTLESDEHVEVIESSSADIAISINWQTIIPQSILSRFPSGIINAHAGDLPRYRGNAVVNWAILNEEPEVVLTLHRMTAELDAGPILDQRCFALTPTTYVSEVYSFIRKEVPDMFANTLDAIQSGTVVERAQSDNPADTLRCYPRLANDSLIRWEESADAIVRVIRASAEPFSGAYTYLGSRKIVIWRACSRRLKEACLGIPGQIISIGKSTGTVTVLAGEGAVIIEAIGVEDEAERRSPNSIIHSLRMRFEVALEDRIHGLQREVAELAQRLDAIGK